MPPALSASPRKHRSRSARFTGTFQARTTWWSSICVGSTTPAGSVTSRPSTPRRDRTQPAIGDLRRPARRPLPRLPVSQRGRRGCRRDARRSRHRSRTQAAVHRAPDRRGGGSRRADPYQLGHQLAVLFEGALALATSLNDTAAMIHARSAAEDPHRRGLTAARACAFVRNSAACRVQTRTLAEGSGPTSGFGAGSRRPRRSSC